MRPIAKSEAAKSSTTAPTVAHRWRISMRTRHRKRSMPPVAALAARLSALRIETPIGTCVSASSQLSSSDTAMTTNSGLTISATDEGAR